MSTPNSPDRPVAPAQPAAYRLTSFAFHLPQFHEIPENNAWWGQGFTEWTQLRRAKPWSHRHPVRRPVAPLGEYNLLDPEVLEAQWSLARRHGIDGFAVWDYWFGDGRRLLEKPSELVRERGLDFRYCLAWANHSWLDKSRNVLLCEQRYPGREDHVAHFRQCLKHFETDNYVRIDGKPVFMVFAPHEIPDWRGFFALWHELAREAGFPGMYFIADRLWEGDPMIDIVDEYSNAFRFLTRRNKLVVNYLKEEIAARTKLHWAPRRLDFRRLMRDAIAADAAPNFAPTAFTGWDTTPRHGKRGMIFQNFDRAAFREQLAAADAHFRRHPGRHHTLLLKSWNEWAEGNVMEPDSVFGSALLEEFAAFRQALA